MTPLDVVKIRLQSQDMMRNKCFLYWNGITDHLYPRVNGDPPPQVAPGFVFVINLYRVAY